MRLTAGVLLFLLFSTCLQAQTGKVYKEKEPSWISVNTLDYSASGLDKDAEDGYVDVDYEMQVSVSTATRYFKKAIKILSEAGVQNNSEISVDFDPSYQKLAFHTLRIIRHNQVIEKLATTKFKLVQQEKELDQHLYDGSLTAFSFLEDVRKDDIIEYSYSLTGFNPIFNGKYFGSLDLQYGVPVYNLLYKLILPANRQVEIKNSKTDIKPSIRQSGSETIYEWKLNGIEALHVPGQTPGWYDPYPMVMISEFGSWKEVNDWARTLYPFDLKLSPSLEKKISEIEQENAWPEKKIMAALRFVQDDIRYTGIEAGAGSHKPTSPNKTFAQRFGDCKDKSYLLCVMLRRMGVKADPVLINTQALKGVMNWLPSPGNFDHVTVRVQLAKDVYWFDPTVNYQRGDLKTISYPDYQCGLVVSESTDALTPIPMNEKGQVSVKEIFNVSDMKGGASLLVETAYSGKYADNTREDFKTSSRYEILKRYKQYYSSYFKNIKEDSISYTDDEASGILKTKEYYTIKDFWEFKNGIQKASFKPFIIDDVLSKPDETGRNAPYSLNYPNNYNEVIEINLPEDWTVKQSSDFISTPSMQFRYDYSFSGRQVVLKYEYKGLKDCIDEKELDDYLAAYDKIQDNCGFELTLKDGNGFYSVKGISSATAPSSIYPLLYSVLVISLLITIAVRRNRRRNNWS